MSKLKDFGLYETKYEHDACGIGAVVNINGTRSHQIVSYAKQVLLNLHHRGAAGADEVTGDGAGILMQIPDEFFREKSSKLGINLPCEGEYGVAVVFGSKNEQIRKRCDQILEESVVYYGMLNLGWRDVPSNPSCLGELALEAEPSIKQLFISACGYKDEQLETMLYMARKRAEMLVKQELGDKADDFYIVSMSGRTVNYKGMFMAHQLFEYYPDLEDKKVKTALALVHQRYSTNTFPNWKLAQPFRCLAHNGEINTLNGNRNKMQAREKIMSSPVFGDNITDLFPVLDAKGSDSACFDNVLELLTFAGRSMPHSMMMMIPEAFGAAYHISKDKRSFYEYHSSIMEPWDGPAAMVFTDGRMIGGTLDRNGLRPCRYVVTKDGLVVLASEAGVIEFPAKKVQMNGRLQPGKMFVVDTVQGRIITDNEIKSKISRQKPYRRWIEENRIELGGFFADENPELINEDKLNQRLRMFGYSREELNMVLEPMGRDGQEPVGSMGNDAPLAVLSDKPRLLYDYFKQMFAQVTNPPIDPLREGLVMSLMQFIGKKRNFLEETPLHCKQLKIPHPVLTNQELKRLKNLKSDDFKVAVIESLFNMDNCKTVGEALERGVEKLIMAAKIAIKGGASLLIISDRNADERNMPIPALLATSAVNHGLLNRGLRAEAGIVIETGEAREVMHFCLLCGFGANAVNPYLTFDALEYLRQSSEDLKERFDAVDVQDNFIAAIKKGILKTMSKMGISTLRSYNEAQLFEIIGINKEIVDRYFTGTSSRIQGVGLEEIASDTAARHSNAFNERMPGELGLDFGGDYHYRNDGESHLWNPTTIARLQHAVMFEDKTAYKDFADAVNNQALKLCTLRGLFNFKKTTNSIPIDEVEPASEIVKRFCTGAMSQGSISKEAHETMAIAMNRLGGMSNTGEGGEDPVRYQTEPSGDTRNSAIKQVASGRFGVTINYLAHGKEIQIKMAQGAKPGEGGQLPGHKVTNEIAKLRYSTPGVTLISPPPHHDIYSIEDLAQLIYDLKCSNPSAKVSVKLVSEVGVGTVAAGVAKGNADEVLISGYDGGTGASPLSSIKHAGIPWELGLAETQQVLVMNRLRDRIRVQVDGQLKTGRDVVIGALLGAEQFGFGTGALISLGCIMMRKCHKGMCPVGIATQDTQLRKKFAGKPEYLQRYLMFVAQEVREIMASLGVRKITDLVGRTDLLETTAAIEHYKAKGLDFTAIFTKADNSDGRAIRLVRQQSRKIDDNLDWKIIEKIKTAIDKNETIEIKETIKNVNRTAGAIVSNYIVNKLGMDGLADGQIKIKYHGTAGQSFGAFLIKGVQLHLVGQSNDYVGKGLSGGRIIIETPDDVHFMPSENIIVGNTVLYGATSGELYVNGMAGERFAVRNSGAVAVVEGVGDHCCEYMTGGCVVVLGRTGRNFAAGMSGGIAYVLDEMQLFDTLCNLDMVDLENVWQKEDIERLYDLVSKHYQYTGSTLAKRTLDKWSERVGRFVKVIPLDYKKVLERMKSEETRLTETTPATEEVYHG